MELSVAYCRVSTNNESQKKSIEQQQIQWEELAEENKLKLANCGIFYKKNGQKIATKGLYIDEGISAKDYSHREAFKQMIKDAKNGKFSNILVEDVSRFSRNSVEGINVYKDLREIGVNVHFRKEGLDTLNVSNDVILVFAFAMAEQENQMKSERVKWGISRVHKDGRINTVPSIGYKMKENDKKGVLEIDEKAAEIVKYIFYLYTEKLFGAHKIANVLNERKIKTRKNNIWSATTVRIVLNNRLYIGEQRTHISESYDITRRKRKKIPIEEQIVKEKEELKIIDNEIWNKKEMIMKERTKNLNQRKGHSTTHLFSTLIYCSNCGSVYFRVKRNDYINKNGVNTGGQYSWVCIGRNHHGKKFCNGERFILDEKKLIRFIKKELRNKEKNKEGNEFLLEQYIEREKEKLNNIDIEKLKERKKSINEQMIELRTEKKSNLIDVETYNEQVKELNNRLGIIRNSILENYNITKNIEKAKIEYEEYLKTIKNFNKNSLTNQKLKKVINSIEVLGKKVNGKKEIYLNINYKFLDTLEDELVKEEINGEKIKNRIWCKFE